MHFNICNIKKKIWLICYLKEILTNSVALLRTWINANVMLEAMSVPQTCVCRFNKMHKMTIDIRISGPFIAWLSQQEHHLLPQSFTRDFVQPSIFLSTYSNIFAASRQTAGVGSFPGQSSSAGSDSHWLQGKTKQTRQIQMDDKLQEQTTLSISVRRLATTNP